MPKLTSRPPQYKQCGKYAVVYIDGKKNNLGRWGSPEAKGAYARFEAEWWDNFRRPVPERTVNQTLPGNGEKPLMRSLTKGE